MTTQASPTLERTVGELVAAQPGLARLFERLSFNYCCEGGKSLLAACSQRALDPRDVARQVEAYREEAVTGQDPQLDPSAMTLTELADHIQDTHHVYCRQEIFRLEPLLRKAAGRHQDLNPHLPEVLEIFDGMAREQMDHMDKEENVLFPTIRAIDQTRTLPPRLAMSLTVPVMVMEREHLHTAHALSRIRELTDNYTVPPGGCNTLRAVMHSLQLLEADMHQHLHKENNILFPRAMEKINRKRA